MSPTFKLTPPYFLPLLINILFSQDCAPDPQIGGECILDDWVINVSGIVIMVNIILKGNE